ncbi:1812_t:CDS:1, partial [Scutellospora calospora]
FVDAPEFHRGESLSSTRISPEVFLLDRNLAGSIPYLGFRCPGISPEQFLYYYAHPV